MSSAALKSVLVDAGIPEARAEEAVKDIQFVGDQPTKADFVKLESELKSDMSALDNKAVKRESEIRSDFTKLENGMVQLEAVLSTGLADVHTKIADVHTKIANLETKIAESQTKTLWAQIIIAGVIIAAMRLMGNF